MSRAKAGHTASSGLLPAHICLTISLGSLAASSSVLCLTRRSTGPSRGGFALSLLAGDFPAPPIARLRVGRLTSSVRLHKMRSYKSNQDFYDHIDEVVDSLRSVGHTNVADQIHSLIHKVAWTSSSELFGELRDRFEQALASPIPMPTEIRIDLEDFIFTINKAWDRANGEG